MLKKIVKGVFVSLVIIGIAIYTYFHFSTDEPEVFTLSKNIELPIDKVFPNFDNLQKFKSWSQFFASTKYPHSLYYSPYEGQGASASFYSKKENLEITIKKRKENQYIQYQILEQNSIRPITLEVRFKPKGKTTQLDYQLTLFPDKDLFEENFIENETDFNDKIQLGLVQLKSFVENKIRKENSLGKIQFDSIEVEQLPATNYIGISASTKNNDNDWMKNLIKNYTQLENFVSLEMGLPTDDTGYTTLFMSPKLQMREMSYFLAVPIHQVPKMTNASFTTQNKPASSAFVAYYKGNWEGKQRVIQRLLSHTEKQGKTIQHFSIVFLEKPKKDQPILVKMVVAYD